MLCPKCKKEMIVVERNEVELDYCMFCEGFWFDHDEWNILSKKLISQNLLENAQDIYEIPKAISGEKPIRCPCCCKMVLFCPCLWLSATPLYICTSSSLSILLLTNTLGCFLILAIVNSAAISIGVHVSF